ncbi:putative glutathione-specific gamma-glutamylcyclotransferase 2 [Lineus longissimus]|uniref:putative glutathione-specific gamma-glutamylcyclotransferase 2 n=1 Tax=Lineus longissimus TaxID=88925 RepID=UPI002B4DEDE2
MLIPANGDIPHDARVWIFGYASLIWKPGFEYQRRVLGYIKGFSRRFWQTNATHRGTPDKPGRVATLVPDTESTVWGLAYEVIGQKNIRNAMRHLNGREVMCGGYCLMLANFHPEGEAEVTLPVLAYTATEKNQHYSTTSLTELAEQVVAAEGPAGHNVEYVLRIVDFMKEHVGCEHDNHLLELNRLIRTLLEERSLAVTNLIGDGPICDCDKQTVMHHKKCPVNYWALHKKDILKTVSAVNHNKKYIDLSEIFVRTFAAQVTLHNNPRLETSRA